MVRTSLNANQPNKQINKYVTKKVYYFFRCFFVRYSSLELKMRAALCSSISFHSLPTYANYELMRCVKIKQDNCAQKKQQNNDDDRDNEKKPSTDYRRLCTHSARSLCRTAKCCIDENEEKKKNVITLYFFFA